MSSRNCEDRSFDVDRIIVALLKIVDFFAIFSCVVVFFLTIGHGLQPTSRLNGPVVTDFRGHQYEGKDWNQSLCSSVVDKITFKVCVMRRFPGSSIMKLKKV